MKKVAQDIGTTRTTDGIGMDSGEVTQHTMVEEKEPPALLFENGDFTKSDEFPSLSEAQEMATARKNANKHGNAATDTEKEKQDIDMEGFQVAVKVVKRKEKAASVMQIASVTWLGDETDEKDSVLNHVMNSPSGLVARSHNTEGRREEEQ